ncbi:MAG: sodium:solute symporter family protein [Acidobacteriota bacterium]|jgi:Na+/proline symporter|nr:sodium:solute symporter family protein [Acidobacteriota bacterium]OQB58921.1 MAG: Sodium/pantothenate symporter [Candidatus Aminicenantes bacterium ADurb.Bin147]HNQ80778.1 sodium:solute symporter family protein [Candidatus Aminicenantes bacterium]MDD8011657.1 sodium:solute symporter family protein [Acidobacteriota bacterium]MDD8029172.1 sodium:solute symporter family protein [Acidobacteriota bacterium]
MSLYLYIILAYLLVLTGMNFYRARKIKSQEDYQVAGRSLKWQVMVFTLICTWIGSGTFISGAEFAAKAGISALWLAAGAWVGIVLIYFLAAKIHRFGQYTIGDILEVRYGPAARLFGAIALILSFVSIVSYQFVAGGFILNVASDGKISAPLGTLIAAAFVILFTAVGGMVAIAYTDLPNGIIIVLACLAAVPFVYAASGGIETARQALPPGYFAAVNSQFGAHPVLKAVGYFLSTLFLLLGVQSMYQKFYSAKSARDARKAVIWWTLGTIFVESVVVIIAVFAFSKLQGQIDLSVPKEGGKVVLMAARSLVPAPVGVLLLGAACAVVISTGMNYLLSQSTTIMRDIYQRFVKKDAEARRIIALQKILVVVVGILAFLMATQLRSILETSMFAYTIYGAAVTPALIAALVWKRATKAGGLASIIGGTVVCLFFFIMTRILPPDRVPDGDPWGIPLIYPALIVSIGSLIVVSLLTPRPEPKIIEKLFPSP